MEVEIISPESYAEESYKALFTLIMADVGKAALIEYARIVLEPKTPLFIFSIRMKANPADKTIGDVANVRVDGGNVHITVSDERYAPDILSKLWQRYGRDSVDQQTRFDMDVAGADDEELSALVVSSSEESTSEIIGALWRTMPEGIKNRHTYISGPVITVVATEELLKPEMLARGKEMHREMEVDSDV